MHIINHSSSFSLFSFANRWDNLQMIALGQWYTVGAGTRWAKSIPVNFELICLRLRGQQQSKAKANCMRWRLILMKKRHFVFIALGFHVLGSSRIISASYSYSLHSAFHLLLKLLKLLQKLMILFKCVVYLTIKCGIPHAWILYMALTCL